MTNFVDFLFGGTDDTAQQRTYEQNQEAKGLILKKAQEAADRLIAMFPGVQDTFYQGTQAGAQVTRQATPAAADVIRQGSQNSQLTQLAGLAGFNDALMGNPIDMSMENLGQYVRNVSPDLSFLNQQTPTFEDVTAFMPGNNQPANNSVPMIDEMGMPTGRNGDERRSRIAQIANMTGLTPQQLASLFG